MLVKESELQCPECGHTKFEVQDDVKDEDFIKCDNCKVEILIADLKSYVSTQDLELAEEQANKFVADELEKMLKANFKRRF